RDGRDLTGTAPAPADTARRSGGVVGGASRPPGALPTPARLGPAWACAAACFRPGGYLKVEGERFRQGVRSTPEGLAWTGSRARLHSPEPGRKSAPYPTRSILLWGCM